MFGNKVKAYDKERTICDFIKRREKYDGETFVKAFFWQEEMSGQSSSAQNFRPIMTANSNEGVFASFGALLTMMRSEHGEHDGTKANMIFNI